MKYDEDYLKQYSFSETGLKRFKNTIEEFEKELFEKSVDFGKANQERDMPLEITSENVRNAAIKLKNNQIKKRIHPLIIIANIFEYIFTILATIGASNLDKDWGKLLFGICIGITVILITARLIYRR